MSVLPVLKLDRLSKRYGSFLAVDQLSLELSPGAIFAFLGTNGAGKTTTIKMMTGIIPPSEGRIEICGYDLAEHPLEAKRRIGVVADRPYLYSRLTADEYLRFIADLYQVSRHESLPRIADLLAEFALTSVAHDLIETYSHGMKQRLAMCGALIHRPKLLVLDEPMVGLDPRGMRLLKDILKRYAAAGMTIFMSTHSLSIAEEIADRVAIIDHGKMMVDGSLKEIMSLTEGTDSDLEAVFLQIISASADEDIC